MMTIIHIVEVAIVAKILYRIARFFIGSKISKSSNKGFKKRSITRKVGTLIANRIHYKLDDKIKLQKEKRLAAIEPQTSPNVIVMKNYKRTNAK